MSLDANTPGRNPAELSESGSSTAVTTSGAVRSATTYQRTSTRHLNNRERRS
jgi:hypothetical protein